MKTHLLTSHAIVDVDRPERWAKQLVSHLSRKASLDRTVDGDVLTIGTGHGVVSVQQDRLVLRAAAPDAESLSRIEDVLARHFERFARGEGASVIWIR
jgi:hypothetical protein